MKRRADRFTRDWATIRAVHRFVVAGVLCAAVTTPAQEPRFEAASVKRSAPAPSISPSMFWQGTTWRARDTTVFAMVRTAYPGHPIAQVEGAPAWAQQELYDVEARAADGVTSPDVLAMIRSLLRERFGLETHEERRDLPVYALMKEDGAPGKGVSAPRVDCSDVRERGITAGRDGQPIDPERCYIGVLPLPLAESTQLNATRHLIARDVTVARILMILSNYAGRPVIDRIGGSEHVDVEMYFTTDDELRAGEPGSSLREALSKQLGWHLVDTRAPVDVLVIDRVHRPTPN